MSYEVIVDRQVRQCHADQLLNRTESAMEAAASSRTFPSRELELPSSDPPISTQPELEQESLESVRA